MKGEGEIISVEMVFVLVDIFYLVRKENLPLVALLGIQKSYLGP